MVSWREWFLHVLLESGFLCVISYDNSPHVLIKPGITMGRKALQRLNPNKNNKTIEICCSLCSHPLMMRIQYQQGSLVETAALCFSVWLASLPLEATCLTSLFLTQCMQGNNKESPSTVTLFLHTHSKYMHQHIIFFTENTKVCKCKNSANTHAKSATIRFCVSYSQINK